MKNRILIMAALLLTVGISSGCHWFVPGAIKRETSLMNVDVNTCLEEISNIENDQTKPEIERLKAVNEKAKRTLNRLKPHVENLDNYTHGRPASR